jgi:hypothetical protein
MIYINEYRFSAGVLHESVAEWRQTARAVLPDRSMISASNVE